MSDTMLSGPSSPRRRARVVLRLALATACVAALAFPVSAQRSVFPDTPNPTAGNVEVFHVQGKVWLLAGAGGNITAQVGDDGLVLVDTGLEAFSERVLTELRALSEKPIRMIVNTTVARVDPQPGNRTQLE